MRGGWKVNATEYNHQMSIEERYRRTTAFKAKNNFSIYWIVVTIILLALFA